MGPALRSGAPSACFRAIIAFWLCLCVEGNLRGRVAGGRRAGDAAAARPKSARRIRMQKLARFALEHPKPSDSVRCPISVAKEMLKGGVKSTDVINQGNVEPIPGPVGIESAWHVMKIPVYGIEEATLRWGESFGPIVRFDNSKLGIKSWVFVNEPDIIEHICFKNSLNYKERYLPEIYKFATQEKGILGSSGEYNIKHRRMCKAPFNSKRYLENFGTIITTMARDLTNAWKDSNQNGQVTVDVSDHMQRLTLDVIGSVAFSYNFGGIDYVKRSLSGDVGMNQDDRLTELVNSWTHHVGKLAGPFINDAMLQAGTKFGDPRLTELKQVIEDMRGILFPLIEERRNALIRGEEVPEDLMTTLIRNQQEQGMEDFTDVDLWEDIHDVMGAGHETTANTLSTALWEIAMHPEVGEKIRKELEAVTGLGKDARLPTYDDFEEGRLPYTTAVVKESLRLYPSIPLFVREVENDDVLPGNMKIHGGDVVFMSAYALGRTERFWDDTLTFDPDRFSEENMAERSPYTWLPFGAGPRMCLGSRFAMMSTVLQLATVMQSYSFDAVQPNVRSKTRGDIPYLGAWRGGMPFEYDMTIAFPEGCTLRATPL